MKQYEINWPAVRAFCRVMNPIFESHEMGRQMDAGFDGGEFSGPAHDKIWEKEYTEIAKRVGSKFGLTADQMSSHAWNASHWNDAYFWEAQMGGHLCEVQDKGYCRKCKAWADPAGGIHEADEENPAKMYE